MPADVFTFGDSRKMADQLTDPLRELPFGMPQLDRLPAVALVSLSVKT
jgi:hypothetical protein